LSTTKHPTSVYFDIDSWKTFLKNVKEREGKTGSQRLQEFLDDYNAKCNARGEQQVSLEEYTSMKRQYERLVKDVDALEQNLVKKYKKGILEQLVAFAQSEGLDLKDLHNFDQAMVSKLLLAWTKDTSVMHRFITLLETRREKMELEVKLTEARGVDYAKLKEAEKEREAEKLKEQAAEAEMRRRAEARRNRASSITVSVNGSGQEAQTEDEEEEN